MKEDFKDNQKPLIISIEGAMYEWHNQYITGAEVKQLAGIPLEQELYLSLQDPWDDELIENNTKVNLARPGIECFLIRRLLLFSINGNIVRWHKQYITGKQIRKIGAIDSDDELFLKMTEPYDDELVEDETIVDLARPGVEHFISQRPKKFKIIVNGMLKEWIEFQVSFDQVIVLAFGSIDYNSKAYTVTYSKGPKENPKGSMVKSDSVYVKSKMNFNVTATNKS